MLIGLSVLVLGLTYGVQMVGQNQENRSKAASELETKTEITEANSLCGSSNGLSVSSRPIEGLCSRGSAIWIDSVASEGEYSWSCIDKNSSEKSECGAFLED